MAVKTLNRLDKGELAAMRAQAADFLTRSGLAAGELPLGECATDQAE